MRSKRSRVLVSAVLVGLAAALATTAGARGPGQSREDEAPTPRALTKADRAALHKMLHKIVNQRNATWRWQDVMLKPRTPYAGTAEKSTSRVLRRWVLNVWEKRAKQAWRAAQRPPHYDEWLCIHRYEGSWVDPNAPYYGGLQMDLSFQRAYGGPLLENKGTADHWSPLEQMWVAERAHASGRGFYPWPNTARFCGLL